MRILCWNVLNTNTDFEAFRAVASNAAADVMVFQELSDAHVTLLKNLPGWQFCQARDCYEGDQLYYLGIATKIPVSEQDVVAINAAEAISPSPMGRWNKWRECLDAQAVTILDGGVPLRVVNLHLTCACSPT